MVKQGKSMTSFFEEDHSAAKERISALRSRIATECSSEQQLLAAYFDARMEMTERKVDDFTNYLRTATGLLRVIKWLATLSALLGTAYAGFHKHIHF